MMNHNFHTPSRHAYLTYLFLCWQSCYRISNQETADYFSFFFFDECSYSRKAYSFIFIFRHDNCNVIYCLFGCHAVLHAFFVLLSIHRYLSRENCYS